jgi:PAS domain S-box-containing protein
VSQALDALQSAVAVALFLLGVLTFLDWVRHRDDSRRYLMLAVGSLGILGVLSRITVASDAVQTVLTVLSLVLLMGSAYAFALFRHSLIAVARPWLRACAVAVVVTTLAGIAVNVPVSAAQPTGLQLAVDIVLLLTWCVIVGASIEELWRVSGTLPRIQRARLRALNAGFAGLIIALLGTIIVTVASSNTSAQVAVETVVLVSMPFLAIALSPPVWLRRNWREAEEVNLRGALNDLLLYSPDEATLASRALEWAARLLGGGAALVALNGRVLAVSGGISMPQGERLQRELEGFRDEVSISFTSALGPAAVVPLRSQAGEGFLAVLAGPLTPLFGDEELTRLVQYAISITVALDRVHLVAGVRRNADLLDLAYDAIFSWDFGSRDIHYWNKAAFELYGYSAEEAVGSDAQPLLQTEYPQPFDSIVAALRENDHWEGQLRQRAKDGRVLPISARWALQRDQEGRPLAVIEINRDISHEKRAAEELRAARDAAEHASNAKSEYLSRMSHELRTPLAAMLGFSDLLEMREPRPDQMQAIDAIQRAGSHLLSLVNDVLDIARIEAGRESLSVRPLDLRTVLEESVGLVRQTASERRIDLVSRVDSVGPVYVRADRQRLVQVMLNLLSNGIKYGSEGGSVTAVGGVRNGAVEIDVIDDGPGLSEADQERLFQPFERLGAERSHIPGTGLGLALARQLTTAMGGSLGVRSAKGMGATFTVRLDRARATDAESVVRATAPPVLRDAAKERTVLYVEDNLATIALVESIVALRPNVRLLTAMQGGIALDLAREHQPELIVLDLHLPDIDGDEVIERLRADPRTAHIPVVMYSADATDRQVERLIAAGASEYLTKPARVPQFLEMVDRALGQPADLRRRA